MLREIKEVYEKIAKYFEPEEQSIVSNNTKSLLVLVEEAKKEWLSAKQYFDNVTEPELIDYAVHSIKATEQRYNYLLRKIKKMELEEIK